LNELYALLRLLIQMNQGYQLWQWFPDKWRLILENGSKNNVSHNFCSAFSKTNRFWSRITP